MIQAFEQILQGVLDRLQNQATTVLPALLAALIIMVLSLVVAVLTRALLYRIFKGLALDRFLRRTGVAYAIDRAGRFRATRIVAETAYFGVLLTGFLTGLSAFNNQVTDQLIQGFVLLLPRLLVAAVIIVAAVWASHYFGRSLLVWAVNEGLPGPRRLAAICRVVIVFVAIVVAADQLDFAPRVFLAAFIILAGGVAIIVSIALGTVAAGELRRLIAGQRERNEPERERSLWNQL
jgi:hypothetical protein